MDELKKREAYEKPVLALLYLNPAELIAASGDPVPPPEIPEEGEFIPASTLYNF